MTVTDSVAAKAATARNETFDTPLDPSLGPVVEGFHEVFDRPMREIGAADIRARRAAMRRPADPAHLADSSDISIPGRDGWIPARHYRPQNGTSAGVIVYFHGGGWVFGGIDESDSLAALLTYLTGCEVVSVGYRLAPEHRYPSALHDAVDSVTWASENFANDTPLVVMGDSAGGNLVAAVAQYCRQDGRPALTLQVLIYPVLDHRMRTESFVTQGTRLFIGADDMDWFWSQYITDPVQRGEVGASPGLEPALRGVAPALVVVAGHDPLRDEVLEYAACLEEAAVPTKVYRYDSMAHGFFTLLGTVDAADDAVRSVSAAIADAVRNRPAGRT